MAKVHPLFKILKNNEDKREIIFRGGRYWGKTHTIIEKLLIDFVNEDRCNYLFSVFNSNKARHAFFPTIRHVNSQYNLGLRILEGTLEVVNAHGYKIICKGFDKVVDVKVVSKIGKSFIDEADGMPYLIAEAIRKTTREIPDAQVIYALNPSSPDIWINTKKEQNPRFYKTGIVVTGTCESNIFGSEEAKQMYRDLDPDSDDYAIDYLGNYGTATGDLIFGDKLRRVMSIPDHARFVAYGMDYSNGGSDPHGIVEIWVADQEIYGKEIYQGNCDQSLIEGNSVIFDKDHDDLASILRHRCPELNQMHEDGMACCVADSANKGVSDHLRAIGFNVVDAKKGAGSVLEGIKLLKMFKRINILESSTNLVSQMFNYRWKKGTDGEIINGEPDKTCKRHLIDAFRYGNEMIHWG